METLSSCDPAPVAPAVPAAALSTPVARLLSETTLAPGYSDRITAFVAQIATASDAVVALQLLHQVSTALGAEGAAFISFIPGEGSQASFRGLLACDSKWCFEYKKHTAFSDDPWLEYASFHADPICASSIVVEDATKQSAMSLALRFGFQSVVIVPAPSSVGLSRAGMLCLGSSTPGYFEADGFFTLSTVARGVAMQLNAWCIARVREEIISEAKLHESELQLLRWERQGLNSKQMANRLAIRAPCVDTRFQRVNVKLGVPNRRCAAQLAAECGLI
jgi:DNA-binding CsgD family transcriptional regulator